MFFKLVSTVEFTFNLLQVVLVQPVAFDYKAKILNLSNQRANNSGLVNISTLKITNFDCAVLTLPADLVSDAANLTVFAETFS